jgi:hypothetical protein
MIEMSAMAELKPFDFICFGRSAVADMEKG